MRAVVDAQMPKSETLAFTVSVDGTAITWDLHTGAVVASIAPEASTAKDVDWSVMTARVDTDKGQVDFLIRDADFRYASGEVHSYDLTTGADVPSPLAKPDILFRKSPLDLGASVSNSSYRARKRAAKQKLENPELRLRGETPLSNRVSV